jgi:hypothetical protein
MVSALCRLNERGRWALSQAEFMKGLGKKGRGAGLVFVFSLLRLCRWAMRLPSGVQPQWVDAFGSRPGQQCNGQSLDAGPGEPTCTACWQSIRVRSAQETRSCCMGPYAAGGSKPSF